LLSAQKSPAEIQPGFFVPARLLKNADN